MRCAYFFLLLLLTTACAETGNGLDPAWHHRYQDYLTKGHYRAFAATFPSGSRMATAIGYSYYRTNVQDAIETALENCKKGERQHLQIGTCRLYAIGNIVVVRMKPKEIEAAKEFYRLRPTASQKDYELGKPE